MTKLRGKTAVVTGAAGGIGAAVATLFAAEGARVILCDVLENEGRATSAAINGDTLFQSLDVTDEDSWMALSQAFGTIDILINNAAIAIADIITNMSKADFEKVMAVNVVGPFLGIKHLAPGMIAQGGGAIINISSNQGLIASNAMAAYASSKWALRGLSKVAALELGTMGVRVNTVFPGPVNTRMGNPADIAEQDLNQHPSLQRQPIRRVAHPSEVAPLCLFLASDDASYITGSEVTVDGGMTIGQYIDFLPGGD